MGLEYGGADFRVLDTAGGKWVLSSTNLREHGNDGMPPDFHGKFVHQMLAPPRQGWKEILHFCGRIPALTWPGEQREEPCVLRQEQGQEILIPSLLLVLLSLK